MSQDDIIKALEENDMSIKELYQRLNDISQVAIRVAIHQLVKYEEVIKEYQNNQAIYKLKENKKERGKSPSKKKLK